jgi:fructosamine-3-kinase
MVIDPAVYYGHPEIDLAHLGIFQDVPEDVFIGYQELLPIDPGFHERRDLWRVPSYLAVVTVEGAGYLNQLTNAIQKYL